MDCKIKDIEILFNDNAILPNYSDYEINPTSDFDRQWHSQKNALDDAIINYLKILPEDACEYFSLAPYHNDEYQFWIFIFSPCVLNVGFFDLLISLAKENNCFYMLECNIPYGENSCYGQIAVSSTHIVFGSLSDDGKLPEISGLLM